MAHGVILEAEYEDGFVLTEDEADQSPYDEGKNVFNAILHGRPEAEHGRMVRWSAVTPKKTYSVDWRDLWATENPRPIYFRDMERDFDPSIGDWTGPPRAKRHCFGYQYNAADGSNVQEVQEL